MLCVECGSKAQKGYTTDVTDLGNCIVIVRNVPCYKCSECNEVIYTADVVEKLEKIIETAKKFIQEISIIDYSKVAWCGCIKEATAENAKRKAGATPALFYAIP